MRFIPSRLTVLALVAIGFAMSSAGHAETNLTALVMLCPDSATPF